LLSAKKDNLALSRDRGLTMLNDIRIALRGLTRVPGFALAFTT
jgi:hypothetical protein